jgi:metallophosphoesterase (TIGR00282 family)
MIGDIVGKPGRAAIRSVLPGLREFYNIDLVVANGENASGGFGLTLEVARELLSEGIDVLTSGNHIWDQKDILPHLDSDLPILRPLNYPEGTVGRGYLQQGDILIVNLMGRTFMQALDCPFRAMDRLLDELDPVPKAILVDFHAEATSEKVAMGWYLDGRVSGVVGTHTHVGTVDTRILPSGTAFVTDLGMVGTMNSVIGSTTEDVLFRFLTQQPRRLNVAIGGPLRFNSVLVDIDTSTGVALNIERIDRQVDE